MPDAERREFAAEKHFTHEAVKRREWRTNLKSAPPKGEGLGILWDKRGGWLEVWGEMIGGKKKVT